MTLVIGCSPILGRIYITVIRERKDGSRVWTNNRTDVTDDAVRAVLHYLKKTYADFFNGEGEIEISGKWANGKKYKLTYTEIKDGKE